MPVRNLFKGRNVVLTLLLLLAFLIYSELQQYDGSLLSRVNQNPIPTPTVTEEVVEEDIIEEHEPEEASQSSQAVEGVSTGRQIGQVVKVVDGDTMEVELGGTREKIRIIGLDTPETVDPRRGVQCFGKEASNFAKQTLIGKTVYLESDPTQADRDKYQRLLRFIFLNEGATDFSKLMIQEGYGHEYTYDLPYKYQKEYKQAEQEAKTNKKGLWADNVCPN